MSAQWQAAGFCVRGARHVVENTPCQDALQILESSDVVVLAVADGHGDQKHFRSAEGAQLAVQVAAQLLEEAAKDLLYEQRTPSQIEDALKFHLPRRISWEWNRQVKIKIGLDNDGLWHDQLVSFGTTIMAAAVTEKFGLFVQLGDGDMLLISQDGIGELVFQPDPEMYGSFTHSLCQPNNPSHARVRCLAWNRPRLFLASTDGLRDSLQGDEERYIQVGRWLIQRIDNEGWNEVLKSLPDWLAQLSAKGNGDDTTVALLQWNKEE